MIFYNTQRPLKSLGLKSPIEYEEEIFYDVEDKIWAEIERLLKREVEMLVLNRVPSSVAQALYGAFPWQ